MRTGRPSKYSVELADKICELIAQGHSEHSVSKMDGMPDASTLRNWKDKHPEFLVKSVRAREESADLWNARRMEIAETLQVIAANKIEDGTAFPKGTVEALKTVMQEYAREAAYRDDSRYGNRKTVKVETSGDSEGLVAIYAKMKTANAEND